MALLRSAFLVTLLISAATACSDHPPAKRTDGAIERGVPTPAGWTPAVSEPPSPPSPVAGNSTPAAPQLVPEAAKGEKGARDRLLAWARAIELGNFGEAWTMLSPSDRAKWSQSEWADQFAGLGEVTVAVPTGQMEGATGSLYYTAPVTITANDRQSRPVRLEGEAVLRRVNDVDGATPAQLRWHFERVTLDWVH